MSGSITPGIAKLSRKPAVYGQDDVGDADAEDEEEQRQRDPRPGHAPLVGRQPGRHERPQLVQHERRGEGDADHQRPA